MTLPMPNDYPANEAEWNAEPFGEVMWKAFSEPVENVKRGFEKHNKQVFDAMKLIWDPANDDRIIHDSGLGPKEKLDGIASLGLCRDVLRGIRIGNHVAMPGGLIREELEEVAKERIFGPYGNTELSELLYAALFHDIGKSIVNERHPVVGWHVVADLHPEKKAKLIERLRVAEKGDEQRGNARFQRLLMLIRDHDKFGVLSTGEASMPILLPVARYTETEQLEARRSLAMLFMLTLADIAASDGAKPNINDKENEVALSGHKVMLVCKDWLMFDQAIRRTGGQRERLAEETLRLSKSSAATIERIRRLIAEASKSLMDGSKLKQEVNSVTLIESALEDAFGPNAQGFCEDFALIAKLDYGLTFFRNLMAIGDSNNITAEEIIELVIAILRRITAAYKGLTRQEHSSFAVQSGVFNTVGVGFQNLNDKKKSERIINLLFLRRERALRWLVDEITGWQTV